MESGVGCVKRGHYRARARPDGVRGIGDHSVANKHTKEKQKKSEQGEAGGGGRLFRVYPNT